MPYSDSSQHYKELLNLSKEPSVDHGDIEGALKCITESLARGLNTSRASIWLYNKDHTAIVCEALYVREEGLHSRGMELKAQDFPAYFSFLTEERILAAHDAHTHHATVEFSHVYLKPLGIASMLDAPIRLNGVVVGVICCEHVGAQRKWNAAEEIFVANMTDIVARAYQAKARAEAVRELERINLNLENLVKERTESLKWALAKTAHSSKLASVGEMAGSIAHEINTPLNAILLSAEQTQDWLTRPQLDIAQITSSVELITATTLHISKIVKGLLTFSRGGTGEHALHDFHDIMDQTLSLCLQKIRNRGVDFRLRRASSPLIINCDPSQVGQVLLNLLNNSFDAVSKFDGSWISIETESNDEFLRIYVSDSGKTPGAEIQKNLFTPFFTTKNQEGIGIGLNISKGIVEKHGGRIYLDPLSPNTRFVVEIPLHFSASLAG